MSDTPSENLSPNGTATAAPPSLEATTCVSTRPVGLKRFLAELRHRGVLKAATAYLIVSWLTLEIGHTLFNIFELPHGGLQLIFALLALGLPLVLLGVWEGWIGTAAREDEHGHAEIAHGSSPHDGPWLAIIFGAVALIAVAVAIGMRFLGMGQSGHGQPEVATAAPHVAPPTTTPPASFAPPPHSIAVLPFVNMSGDPNQEYFSDGLAEELLNSLARIETLHVTARTSSFSFKGKDVDIATIAQKLNVGAVLEGSVRRAGERVRITAQLINPVTGFHLWSHTYDRDLKDIFALQSEIAQSIASALEGTLLGERVAKLELGGTENPQAFDAYLQGMRIYNGALNEAAARASLAAFDAAIALDPQYALAHIARTRALRWNANYADTPVRLATRAQARAAAEKAISIAPDLGEAHAALGGALLDLLDFTNSAAAYERALALAPGSAAVQRSYQLLATVLGRHAAAIASAQRAIALDPLTATSHTALGNSLLYSRQYEQALVAFRRAENLGEPDFIGTGITNLLLGRTEVARAECTKELDNEYKEICLAIAYHRLGRISDAEKELAKFKVNSGEGASCGSTAIYAEWGEPALALKSLTSCYRIHGLALAFVQVDPLLDPIRDRAEFKEIVRRLNFPK